MLPAAHEVRFRYTAFLMGRGEYAHAGPFLEGLASSTSGEDVVVLNSWCEALLENFEVGAAERAWKKLRSRGLLNEDAPPWQAPDVKGATVHKLGDSAWRILLTGEQPEQCMLLTRVFESRSGKSRLEWTMDAELSAAAGLSWQVESYERTPRVLAKSGELHSGAGSLDFDASPMGPVRITLQFKRPLGSVRAEGRLTIKDVRVTEVRP